MKNLKLNPRQETIFKGLFDGKTNAEIANLALCHERTVRDYRKVFNGFTAFKSGETINELLRLYCLKHEIEMPKKQQPKTSPELDLLLLLKHIESKILEYQEQRQSILNLIEMQKNEIDTRTILVQKYKAPPARLFQ